MRRVARELLQFESGARFSYSNSGYVVLGAIVQAISRQSYYYVRQHVFKPAGMAHTGWYALDQVPNMAHGYTALRSPGKATELQDSRGAEGHGNPSGGAYATAGDLLRFARALLAHKLLGPAMTNTVVSGTVDTGRPGPARVSKYGYGFEDEQINGTRVIGHGGGAPGIEAQLRIYPTLGYTVVILANLDAAATPVYTHVNEILARNP
jgi:CubicO group peptidase (beta-lactamase class C family)